MQSKKSLIMLGLTLALGILLVFAFGQRQDGSHQQKIQTERDLAPKQDLTDGPRPVYKPSTITQEKPPARPTLRQSVSSGLETRPSLKAEPQPKAVAKSFPSIRVGDRLLTSDDELVSKPQELEAQIGNTDSSLAQRIIAFRRLKASSPQQAQQQLQKLDRQDPLRVYYQTKAESQ